jgi:hypothetical protein
MGRAVPPSSEGHSYHGPLRDGYWVDAADLTAGYRLLNADQSWAEVVLVEVVDAPLRAYNLTVADYHTYFVAANENASPVWVHNDCGFGSRRAAFHGAKEKVGIPKTAQYKRIYREKLRDPNSPDGWARDANGKIIETRNYVYEHPEFGDIVLKEHSIGHSAFSGNASKKHFNIEKFHGVDETGQSITSSISDISGHYYWD